MKLQEKYAEFKKHRVRKLFACSGKNKDGAEGIKKARTQTGAVFPILLDPGAVETAL